MVTAGRPPTLDYPPVASRRLWDQLEAVAANLKGDLAVHRIAWSPINTALICANTRWNRVGVRRLTSVHKSVTLWRSSA
jgi:hypothetical protein